MNYESLMQQDLQPISLGSMRKILKREYDNEYYKEEVNTIFITNFIIDGEISGNVGWIDIDVRVMFSKCIFKTKQFPFTRLNFKDELMVIDCHFLNDIAVDNVTCSSKAILGRNTFQTIHFKGGKFQSITFSPTKVSTLIMTETEFSKFNILTDSSDRISIDSLMLVNLNDKTGSLFITGIDVDVFTLSGHNDDERYELTNIRVNIMHFLAFQNRGELHCKNIESLRGKDTTVFQVSGSNLNKAEFYSMKFDSFGYFAVNDSYIADCLFLKCTWNKSIRGVQLFVYNENLKYDLAIKETEYESIKDVCRQLKMSMAKHNDKIQEAVFYEQEMNYHTKLLNYFPLSRSTTDKAILKLSSITSGYGQSFFKPLFWLIGGHFILFCIALVFHAFIPLQISFANPTWDGFVKGFEYFFTYINPFRPTNTSMKGLLIFVDLMMRVWSGYMIYNLIRVSRRFIS